MGKKVRTPKDELLAVAPSVRKGELFRATSRGLERVQVNEMRNGGKHQRKDELPYSRISSVSHEEKVTRKGSWVLAAVAVVLILAGIGIPGLSMIPSLAGHVTGSRLSILEDGLALQNISSYTIGFLLFALAYPRKTSDKWWQIRGPGLSQDEHNGWQISAGAKESARLVDAVRDGINRSRNRLGED